MCVVCCNLLYMVGKVRLMFTSSRTRWQDGVTLLMYAIDKHNEYMLKALIDRGADLNYENAVGFRCVFLE